ncbi:MAG: hypothetical protein WCJ30_18670 [Deltaproteobacteria bacterium]
MFALRLLRELWLSDNDLAPDPRAFERLAALPALRSVDVGRNPRVKANTDAIRAAAPLLEIRSY